MPVNGFEGQSLAAAGAIVLYSEYVLGNPYRAHRVVRWLLHHPMHLRRRMAWSHGDIVVRFSDHLPMPVIEGIHTLPLDLKVTSYPVDLYKSARQVQRSGCAHVIRKGHGKAPIHPEGSILIDGLPHAETAKILGCVERLICYDSLTAYAQLGALAGAQVMVVPEPGLSKEKWLPNEASRWGIAYGPDDLSWAAETAHLVEGHLRKDDDSSAAAVSAFVDALPWQDPPIG